MRGIFSDRYSIDIESRLIVTFCTNVRLKKKKRFHCLKKNEYNENRKIYSPKLSVEILDLSESYRFEDKIYTE